LLASEIVDEVYAVISLQLERRLVAIRRTIVAETEHIERKLAAADDEWPLALYPTAVVRAVDGDGQNGRLLIGVEALVKDGVEDLDDVALAFNRVGHKDGRAFEIVELLHQIS